MGLYSRGKGGAAKALEVTMCGTDTYVEDTNSDASHYARVLAILLYRTVRAARAARAARASSGARTSRTAKRWTGIEVNGGQLSRGAR
jgi:hypothetical protein